MRPSSRAARVLFSVAVATLLASACNTRPPSHALTVRNLESKCALIAFSGCRAPAQADDQADAGGD